MKRIISDLLPIALFFSAYMYTNNIYIATKVIVLSCIFQLAYTKFFQFKIKKINVISNVIIILLGSTTIFLESDIFIKSKPTIVYWMMGLTILFLQDNFKKDIIRSSLENKIKLSQKIWNYINKFWICFFITMGFINILIAFSDLFSEKEWVIFKTIGFPIVFTIFFVIQFMFFKKHIK
ncbi:inner membrane-spanning protein YciB [Candidatus Kinetoplastidibacterium galati]|uniref:Inner membrane-spanning protein YciB n=1 Tax=Candidatus Kinetoplastidibacterium galati TCC219 TaxID=1208921 RepID=M1LUE6_9PROT|nr:septation protein IspZ [Candidatus Kinetoplastibacterium galatii]AGF49182.1 intracellular septation protein [Candidatus Kinetoplastibacterium galatii TCC219]